MTVGCGAIVCAIPCGSLYIAVAGNIDSTDDSDADTFDTMLDILETVLEITYDMNSDVTTVDTESSL